MGPDYERENRLLYARIIIIRVTTENVTRRLVKKIIKPQNRNHVAE
jgi:hypothetical protein